MEALPKSLQNVFQAAMAENKYFEWNKKEKPDSLDVILTWTQLETGPMDRDFPAELQDEIGKANAQYKYFEWYVNKRDEMTQMFLIWKGNDEGMRNQYATRANPPDGQTPEDDKMIMIFVKTLQREILTVTMEKDATIQHLSNVLRKITEIPEDAQRLVFAGKQTEPGRTLSDYNINNESIIHLLTRLKGD